MVLKMFGKYILFGFFVNVVSTGLVPTVTNSSFQLHIIHLNDFHARFDETSTSGGACKENCIGGFSRIYTATHQQLQKYPDSIVLNAGDNFQGTLWYNLHKWNVTQYFLNKLPTDVYTIGNHEFDDKIQGVVPFIKALNAPTVAVNIDDSQHPEFQGLYNKSVIITRGGKKIGVIGVLLSTTDQISNSENLKFLDEVETINDEAARLVAEENVDTVIVLSHCGYSVDKRIASNAGPKIGLIVGAHSHSFLYTGDKTPNGKRPIGPYPTIIKHKDGRQILIVQASAYSEFLGDITVNYDDNGNVLSWDGAPIYLDKHISQDEKINQEITIWKKDMDIIGNKVIGHSKVKLDRSNCRRNECNIGNFITDAMVHAYLDTDEKDAWTYASIALTNPGGIRTSIERGDITYSDLITSVPFANTIDVGELQGKYIKELLDHTTQPFNNERIKENLSLLQMSGIRVVYNVTNPAGSRVQSVKIRCRKCLVPKYEPLDPEKFYRIALNSFLVKGGDGYVVFENLVNHKVGGMDSEIIQKYIERETPITQSCDGRIQIVR